MSDDPGAAGTLERSSDKGEPPKKPSRKDRKKAASGRSIASRADEEAAEPPPTSAPDEPRSDRQEAKPPDAPAAQTQRGSRAARRNARKAAEKQTSVSEALRSEPCKCGEDLAAETMRRHIAWLRSAPPAERGTPPVVEDPWAPARYHCNECGTITNHCTICGADWFESFLLPRTAPPQARQVGPPTTDVPSNASTASDVRTATSSSSSAGYRSDSPFFGHQFDEDFLDDWAPGGEW